MQSLAALSLILIAYSICGIKDKKKRVTAHPSILIAQICVIQGILYIFMMTANIPMTCNIMKFNVIKWMIGWVPIKTDLTYYLSSVDENTTTWRLIWYTTHKMVGFMGLFSILLQGFFLVDLLFTWSHPIKYISAQKQVIPIFLALSKVGQFFFFLILEKHIR